MATLDELLEAYDQDHRHPFNRTLYVVGTSTSHLAEIAGLDEGEVAHRGGGEWQATAAGKPTSRWPDPALSDVHSTRSNAQSCRRTDRVLTRLRHLFARKSGASLRRSHMPA
jgi:hypothetical protein